MSNLFNPEKFVKGTLLGADGNAFALMGRFQRLARRQQWSKEDVKIVITEAMEGDYNHLIRTLTAHMTMSEL